MPPSRAPKSHLVSPVAIDKDLVKAVRVTVDEGFYFGKSPLFVLGAGISAKRVPFLAEMASRLIAIIHDCDKIPRRTREFLIHQGDLIVEARASRSDAAEFFSTCQIDVEPMSKVWQEFCHELAMEGLSTPDGTRHCRGLFRLRTQPDPPDSLQPLSGPSLAHIAIASLMTVAACHVLNLNYDPLLFLAMAHLRSKNPTSIPNQHIISLHTADDISAYYSSTNQEYQPAVVNARGDIFYARCTNNRCPDFEKDRSLDKRYAAYQQEEEAFRCSTCHLRSIQLQLSFPGYETKERLVQPVLHRLRDFLGHRVSMIVPIGLSGQWDPYLLSELFDWSLAYSIPIVDVKPKAETAPTAFEAFRHRYFPSIRVGAPRLGSWYQQWPSTADEFMRFLHQNIFSTNVFSIVHLDDSVAVNQPALPLSHG